MQTFLVKKDWYFDFDLISILRTTDTANFNDKKNI